MKRFLTLLILVFSVLPLLAQMPEAFNYQAVARNNAGEALSGQTISVRFSIVSSAPGNPTLYTETRQVTTTAQGVFTVQIGSPGAQSSSGDLGNIDWTNNTTASKSLKVELDIHNAGSFIEMGTLSLLSVPYAFAANTAINATKVGGNEVAVATPNTGDLLRWNGNAWAPKAGPKVYNYGMPSNNVAGGNLSWAWGAQPTSITVNEGDVIVVSISGSLATSQGTMGGVGVSVAYQANNGYVIPFFATGYSSYNGINNTSTPITSSGILKVVSADKPTLAFDEIKPGSYLFGLGIRNTGPYSLNLSSNLNGYIMVY